MSSTRARKVVVVTIGATLLLIAAFFLAMKQLAGSKVRGRREGDRRNLAAVADRAVEWRRAHGPAGCPDVAALAEQPGRRRLASRDHGGRAIVIECDGARVTVRAPSEGLVVTRHVVPATGEGRK